MPRSGSEIASLLPILGEPPARETVAAAAYRRLREAILRGQLPMGARIYEVDLAAAWGVSRTPIRDAIRRLEAEGLVEASPGRGAVVPRLGLDDADELYELREVLESRAARHAAERATGDLDTRLNLLVRAMGTALKTGDADRMCETDIDWHGTIAASAGNRRLGRAIETVGAQVYSIRLRALRGRRRAAKSLREMARVTAAVRGRDGVRAEAAMREHLVSLRAELPVIFQSLEE